MKWHTLLADKELPRLAEAAAQERGGEELSRLAEAAAQERERVKEKSEGGGMKVALARPGLSNLSMSRQKWLLASEVAHSAHRYRVVEAR